MYTCPMHHEVISNKPGTCPKSGMRLVPVEDTIKKHTHHGHDMSQSTHLGFWEKFKMGLGILHAYQGVEDVLPVVEERY